MITYTEEFIEIYNKIEKTKKHTFITGQAGTGKSTLLQYFRLKTEKKRVVLSSTGVSALNVQGQTVHSFFHFKPDITEDKVSSLYIPNDKKRILSQIECIIIDEVSMVRADLLDCIDLILRLYGPESEKSFGGIQMILFGDLYQLPPIVRKEEKEIFRRMYKSPFFFDSKSYKKIRDNVQIIELKKIYRQTEEEFIKILGKIRHKKINNKELIELNKKCCRKIEDKEENTGRYVYLATINKIADKINQDRLKEIQEITHYLIGEIEGDFEKKSLPTQESLEIKEGAQIMMLNNDSNNRWVNGSLGKVIYIPKEINNIKDKAIEVEFEEGRIEEVFAYEWEMFQFKYGEGDKIISEKVGSFTQYPLKLSWAITIHKSQGKTFERMIIDLGYGAFVSGQLYVALSRGVSLNEIILKRPIQFKDIIINQNVEEFYQEILNKN